MRGMIGRKDVRTGAINQLGHYEKIPTGIDKEKLMPSRDYATMMLSCCATVFASMSQ